MARSSGQNSYVATTVQRAIFMMVLCLLLANNMTHARKQKKYKVGGKFGWDTIILQQTWADGKTFYADDILEFIYDYNISNMVVVNQTGYENCRPNEGSQEYNTGDDWIYLPLGYSYYIGTLNPGDCVNGEKLAINALARPK